MVVQKEIGEAKEHFIFIHAVTGCDTVSAMVKAKRKLSN